MDVIDVIQPPPAQREYVVKLSDDEMSLLHSILWGAHSYEIPKPDQDLLWGIRQVLDAQGFTHDTGRWDLRYHA